MYSDSFCSNNGVPPYLRAHASRKSYSPIGGAQDGGVGSNAASRGIGILGLRRALGGVAVFVVFIGAVSRSSSRWIARGGGGAPGADQPLHNVGGTSYRGIFEAFEVSSL
ncbi:unnamed protein product, partial [Hapterophycus canaliculatus]